MFEPDPPFWRSIASTSLEVSSSGQHAIAWTQRDLAFDIGQARRDAGRAAVRKDEADVVFLKQKPKFALPVLSHQAIQSRPEGV